MKRIILTPLFIGGLLIYFASATAQTSSSSEEAIRLIRASQLDSQTLLGLQLEAEVLAKKGKITSEQLACFKNIDRSVFTRLFVTPILTRLNRSEILSATAFFEGPTGIKLLRNSVIPMYRLFGLESREIPQELSRDEQAAVVAFEATSAGQQFIGQNAIAKVPEIYATSISPTTEAIFKLCKPN